MIEFKNWVSVPADFTGICKVYSNNSAFRNNTTSIRHYKNGKLHCEDGPAVKWGNSRFYDTDTSNQFYYKGHYYGVYSIEEWKKKVKELKRQEKLKIFK